MKNQRIKYDFFYLKNKFYMTQNIILNSADVVVVSLLRLLRRKLATGFDTIFIVIG